MIAGGRVLAVIPARGGSKGVPRKNVREAGGRPLIGWTIAAAQGAPSLDRVILSSDDAEIIEVAGRLGLEAPYVRPAALAGDTTPTMDVLLDVHRSYYQAVWPVRTTVHALAHITGGGIPGNLNRVLPAGVDAEIDPKTWRVPLACQVLQEQGGISVDEMRRVFNMGVGLVAACAAADVAAVQAAAREAGVETRRMGHATAGSGTVRFL